MIRILREGFNCSGSYLDVSQSSGRIRLIDRMDVLLRGLELTLPDLHAVFPIRSFISYNDFFFGSHALNWIIIQLTFRFDFQILENMRTKPGVADLMLLNSK